MKIIVSLLLSSFLEAYLEIKVTIFVVANTHVFFKNDIYRFIARLTVENCLPTLLKSVQQY